MISTPPGFVPLCLRSWDGQAVGTEAIAEAEQTRRRERTNGCCKFCGNKRLYTENSDVHSVTLFCKDSTAELSQHSPAPTVMQAHRTLRMF